jgi:DNA-binding NarL/FixJ family response regulator
MGMKAKSSPKKKKIRVAILDDHQGTLDGYAYRLTPYKNINVVATARFGDQLEGMLANGGVDVLLLDVGVPASENDPNPYPLLYMLPRLHEQHPDMTILIISMHKQRTLVKAVMDAGAKGYILKDDRQAIVQLGEIISSVAAGGVYFSEQSFAMLTNKQTSPEGVRPITKRQREVLSLLAAKPDAKMDALAKELNIVPSTLRNLLSDSYKRLKVRNLASAIGRARELGLITPYPPSLNLDS